VDPRPLTSHRYPFREVEASRVMQTDEDSVLKPLLLFEISTLREGNNMSHGPRCVLCPHA